MLYKNMFLKNNEVPIEQILIKSKNFNEININFNTKKSNQIKILFNQDYAEIFWEKFCLIESRLKAELTAFIAKSIDNLDSTHPLKNKQENWLEFLEYLVNSEQNKYIDVFVHHLKQHLIYNKSSTSFIWEDILYFSWANLIDIFMFILSSEKVDLEDKILLIAGVEPNLVENNIDNSNTFVNKVIDYFHFLNKLRKVIVNNYSILDFFIKEKL